ncbi:ClcB-like voltage-gated chloride channel protein [Glaciimonas sp. GG7]
MKHRISKLFEDHTILLLAAIAGVLGAFSTIAFRDGISAIQILLTDHSGSLVAMAKSLPWYWRCITPACGGVVAGMLLHRVGKIPGARGNIDYMEAVAIGDGHIPIRHSLLRSASSMCSIATGGSIGREGSMVQLAALCASLVGRGTRLQPETLRLLVACGAAAGITSAYNAPLAGAFFVTEIVLGSIAMKNFGPVLVASILANMTMRTFSDYHAPYQMPLFPSVSGAEVLLFGVLGVVIGVIAPGFLRTIAFSKKQFQRLPAFLPLRLGLGGLMVGVLSIWTPEVWGNGYSVVNAVLHQPWTVTALMSLLLFKVIATALTTGSGAIGGVFTPALFVGAMVGCVFGLALHTLWPATSAAPFAYAIAGMGAFLAATTKAPLMSILMILEMTLSVQLILPLMLACVVAVLVARAIAETAMYDITIQRTRAVQERQSLRLTTMHALIKPVQTVVPTTATIKEIAALFAQYPVKYVYVTNDAHTFCGVVALKDITAALLNDNTPSRKTAADFLQTRFDSLGPDMPLDEALEHFVKFQGERLPVVERTDPARLLGVVYKTSILEAYCRMNTLA